MTHKSAGQTANVFHHIKMSHLLIDILNVINFQSCEAIPCITYSFKSFSLRELALSSSICSTYICNFKTFPGYRQTLEASRRVYFFLLVS